MKYEYMDGPGKMKKIYLIDVKIQGFGIRKEIYYTNNNI